MAAAFLFVGIPVHYVMAAFLPDTATGSPAAQKFFADVKRAAVLFIVAQVVIVAVHAALVLPLVLGLRSEREVLRSRVLCLPWSRALCPRLRT